MSLREKLTTKEIFKAMKNGMEILFPKKELTFRDKISKFEYLELKKQNRKHSLSAKSIREAAIKNKGDVRQRLRYLKSEEGQQARIYHIALCFLRGKKYSEIEPNVDKKHCIKYDKLYNYLYYSVTREFRAILEEEINKFLQS